MSLPVLHRPFDRLARGTEDRAHRSLVKEDGFFDPERLPSTGAPQVRSRDAFFSGKPATVTSALPPRRSSRRVFTAPRLSPGAARPFTAREVVHLRRLGAGRRLPTSATTTIREHDQRITRTPYTAPRVAPVRSFARHSPLRGRDEPRVAPESQPRFHGSGVGLEGSKALDARHLSTRSLAPRASPQPDRPGHLLSRDSLVTTTGVASPF
jgi:hypothetical protein